MKDQDWIVLMLKIDNIFVFLNKGADGAKW